MSRSSRLAVCLATILWVAGTGSGLAQDEDVASAEDWLARLDAQIADIEAQLEATPDRPELWQQLVMERSMRYAVERNLQGAPLTPEEGRQHGLQLVAEWLAAQPTAAEPYLAWAAYLPQAERAGYLLGHEERLAGNPAYLSRLLGLLSYEGDAATAGRVIDDTLNRGAGRAQYDAIHGYLANADQGARLDTFIDRWLVDHPSDPAAHAALLERQAQRDSSPETIRAAAQRAVDSSDLMNLDSAIRLCGAIRPRAAGEMDDVVEACYGRLLSTDLDENQRGRAIEGFAAFAAVRGRGAEVVQWLEQVPENRRAVVVQPLMEVEIAAGRCGEAVGFARSLGTAGSTAGVAVARLLAACRGEEHHQELMSWAEALDGEGTRYLLDRWYGRSHSGDAIEVARRYLEQHPTDEIVHRAFDQLLERQGELELRETHLRQWLAHPNAGAQARERKDLADLLLEWGRHEDAILVLREGLEAAEEGSRSFLLGPLAEALIRSGRWADADEAIGELAVSEDDYWQGRARYLRAQFAWVQGEGEVAFEELTSYLESTTSPGDEAISAYAALASELGREEALEGTLARLYARLHELGGSVGGGLESWAAEQLERAGRPDLARRYLEAALAVAPDDSKLLQSLARVEGQLGETSGTDHLRRSLDADPYDSTRWRLLVEGQIEEGDVDGALASLAQAYALFERPPQTLQITEAKIRFAQGAYVEVVRLLRPIARTNHYATRALELLREAYRQLGGAS